MKLHLSSYTSLFLTIMLGPRAFTNWVLVQYSLFKHVFETLPITDNQPCADKVKICKILLHSKDFKQMSRNMKVWTKVNFQDSWFWAVGNFWHLHEQVSKSFHQFGKHTVHSLLSHLFLPSLDGAGGSKCIGVCIWALGELYNTHQCWKSWWNRWQHLLQMREFCEIWHGRLWTW